MPYWFEREKIKLSREQRRNTKLTEEEIKEIRELRAKGWSYRKIARKFGIYKEAVSHHPS